MLLWWYKSVQLLQCCFYLIAIWTDFWGMEAQYRQFNTFFILIQIHCRNKNSFILHYQIGVIWKLQYDAYPDIMVMVVIILPGFNQGEIAISLISFYPSVWPPLVYPLVSSSSTFTHHLTLSSIILEILASSPIKERGIQSSQDLVPQKRGGKGGSFHPAQESHKERFLGNRNSSQQG